MLMGSLWSWLIFIGLLSVVGLFIIGLSWIVSREEGVHVVLLIDFGEKLFVLSIYKAELIEEIF